MLALFTWVSIVQGASAYVRALQLDPSVFHHLAYSPGVPRGVVFHFLDERWRQWANGLFGVRETWAGLTEMLVICHFVSCLFFAFAAVNVSLIVARVRVVEQWRVERRNEKRRAVDDDA